MLTRFRTTSAPTFADPPVAGARPDRKADHLRIAAGEAVQHRSGPGLDVIRLRHRALPERDLDAVSLETDLLGHTLGAPLLISAMTGGVPEATAINRRLIDAATEFRLGVTLGSGRRLLDDPSLVSTYRPPRSGRPPLLLANLGAVQLIGPHGPQRAERLIELLDADGLSVHLNPLQEAVQPEGESRYRGVAEALAVTVACLAPVPVIAKEVGFGFGADDLCLLQEAGVAAIDVAGSGGTNWALVEGQRDSFAHAVAAAFADWGQSTAGAVQTAARSGVPVIASGGLRDGVDCAKCLALGARACAMARPLLLAAQADQLGRRLTVITRQLQIAAWLAGASATAALDDRHLQ